MFRYSCDPRHGGPTGRGETDHHISST
jgi:hypothetical protein